MPKTPRIGRDWGWGCYYKSLFGVQVLTIGTLFYAGFDKKGTNSLLDDFYPESPREEALEEEMGVPIDSRDIDDGLQRAWNLSQLERTYRTAHQNWDFFDEQFSLVNRISLEEFNGEASGRANRDGTIRLYCRGQERCSDDGVLMHELAHVWSYTLDTDFWNAWRAIAGRGYHDMDTVGEQDLGDLCRPYMDSVAAVNCHGAKNELEDVAEVVELVYVANYRSRSAWSYDYFSLETIPRLEQKIHLLHQQQAFSDDERDVALRWLKDYRQQQEAPPAEPITPTPTEEPALIPSTTDISSTFTTCVGDDSCIKQTFARQFP